MPEVLMSNHRAAFAAPAVQRAAEGPAVRPILQSFFAELNACQIRYCHWKSNVRLAQALTADDDVDLLVDHRSAAKFHELVLKHGFKRVLSRGGMDHPGVFHAIALDEARSELVHLHAYFQIVSGDSLVKNYRFAVEDALLDDTRVLYGVRVPSPEAELILFTLRHALKHAYAVEILLVRRDAKSATEEFAWLRSAADPARCAELWRDLFPELGEDLFHDLLDVFAHEGSSLRMRVQLARKTASLLRGRRRCGAVAAGLSRAQRVATLLRNRISARRDFVPETGGSIIAFVGPKATGKSTLTNELRRRLGAAYDLEHVHAGKPPATPLTWLPRLLIPAVRKLFPGERSGEYEKPDRASKKHYSLLYCLRMLMLAHDRRVLLTRALRLSTAGAIVISDRYPSGMTGAIDSSCFGDDALDAAGSGLKRWIMRKERAAYARMPKPNYVIRLSAPIETSIARDASRLKDGGPDADAVRRRWTLETGGCYASRTETVRTDRPLEETVANVVRAAWSQI
jgi:thymidylate kinase